MDTSNSQAIETPNTSNAYKEVHAQPVTPDLKDLHLSLITHQQEVPV